jgi:hypothetical protein
MSAVLDQMLMWSPCFVALFFFVLLRYLPPVPLQNSRSQAQLSIGSVPQVPRLISIIGCASAFSSLLSKPEWRSHDKIEKYVQFTNLSKQSLILRRRHRMASSPPAPLEHSLSYTQDPERIRLILAIMRISRASWARPSLIGSFRYGIARVLTVPAKNASSHLGPLSRDCVRRPVLLRRVYPARNIDDQYGAWSA